ncbi:LAFE_0C11430g1_1 [Lachancea fermentati]|uniref:LAFE_0C11430g1_1 n=1 Tax=Lachancea fermentati TaxID=4955 RepID=A0A1G4MA70_LACFM|nr:LAFE_0C11430g1_1 [Lachancea fermentati]
MEIYIRFNDDCENDYAFQVSKEDTFQSKTMKIFEETGGLSHYMVLKPSIFYKDRPIALYKSMHPGFLTENGCVIFHYDADKKEYLEKLDLTDKKIIDQLWPGQLVVPKWEVNRKTVIIYILTILAWLYTDLPDVISPTPGICLTNQVSKRIMVLAYKFNYVGVANKLKEEIQVNSAGVIAQWLFFLLHILKVLIVTSIFYTGMANPISFNPFKFYSTRSIVVTKNKATIKDTLRDLGWIGAKRATYDDYRDTYYKYAIDKAGGMVPAYKSGAMKSAASPGVALTNGEGFQTPLDKRFTESTFKTMEKSGKFVLSEEYFIQLEKDLKENIKKCDGVIPNINAEIRRFRRYGLFECSEELSHLVELRKKAAADAEAAAPTDAKEKKNQ